MKSFLHRSWHRALALALALAAGAAACDGPTDPGREPASIEVAPPGPFSLDIGDTIRIRATLRNAAQPTLRFVSSAPAIASVDDAGLVRGLAPGEATITARSLSDPRATADVLVRVSSVRAAAITIQEVVNEANLPVNPGRVQGTIFVKLMVERGAATRVEVLLDSTVACQQGFMAGVATASDPSLRREPVALTCSVNTAAFDTLTGTPRFFNGTTRLRARLVDAERVLAAAEAQPMVLGNRSILTSRLEATSQAADAGGLRWVDGDVTVSTLPVLYDREGITRVEFAYRPPGGVLQMIPDSTAPYSARFQEATHLRNLTDPTFRISISSITAIGEIGPTVQSEAVRYDNEPPLPGTVAGRVWVGSEYQFASAYTPAPQPDRGVGRVGVRFFAGERTQTDSALVAGGTPVIRGADLRESAANSYRVAGRVCDVLDNCTLVTGFTFGVDLTPPTVRGVSLRDRAINPGADLVIDLDDDRSGFDERPVEAAVLLRRPGAAVCGPVVEGVDLPGTGVGPNCTPERFGSILPVPRTAGGYYTYTATPTDRAGNRAPTITRTVLVDRTPPTVEAVFAPAQVFPGEEGTFSAAAVDDVDLIELGFRLVFSPATGRRGLALPFDTTAVVGVPFDRAPVERESRTVRIPLVRTLAFLGGAAKSVGLVDSVQVQATDAAGQTTSRSRYLDPALYGGNTATVDAFPNVGTAALTVSSARLCTARCAAGDPTALSLEMRIGGAGLDRQPFARVYFFRRHRTTGVVNLLGSVSGLSAVGSISGGQGNFAYSFSHTPSTPLAGDYRIFAVGVSSVGNALATDPEAVNVEFFQR